MNIKQALTYGSKKLNKTITPALDTEVILSFVLKKPKEFFYTYPDRKITKLQENKFKNLITRRAKSEPVAYITGQKEFYGLNFKVDKRVLIPRPETEIIIEEVVASCQSPVANRSLVVADIGTGSGAIIITLAKILPTICNKRLAISYYATDISKQALIVAQQNAKMHKVKINFKQGNLIEPLQNAKLDIITANLPYGDKFYWNKLKNVDSKSLKFEPSLALYSKNKGLDLYQKLFQQINNLKHQPKIIIIEIDDIQATMIKKIINKILNPKSVQIKKDLAGLYRTVIIKL